MKIAILGAYGFLGTHLTEYYIKRGDKVLKLGRDYKSLRILKEYELLIHCAAINRAETPEEVLKGNLDITIKLIENLNKYGIKIPIKFMSSIQEGNGTAYGTAKLKCKMLLQEYCKQNQVIFESYKLPNLFGTKGRPNYNSFVNTFAYNIANNIKCTYNSNPVNLCHVTDAIKVIDNKNADYKLYDTTVEEVYIRLNNLQTSEFDIKLKEILDYYKQL